MARRLDSVGPTQVVAILSTRVSTVKIVSTPEGHADGPFKPLRQPDLVGPTKPDDPLRSLLAEPNYCSGMPLTNTLTTFGDLARDPLAIEVTCPNYGHKRMLDGNAPHLSKRRAAGARFRCKQCGSVGLPSIDKDKLSTRRAQDYVSKLRS
ncbi:MAG: hypothetical protein AAB403_19200 [Planctomycetota bacterium]